MPFAKDADGETAIEIAKTAGNSELVSLLEASAIDDMSEVLDSEPTTLIMPPPVPPREEPALPHDAQQNIAGQEPHQEGGVGHGEEPQAYADDAGKLCLPPPPADLSAYSSTFISKPSAQSTDSATYRMDLGLELRPTSTLRCMIPPWAADRVLQHIQFVHQQESATAAGPAFNRVRVWGCQYAAASLADTAAATWCESTPVVVHGLAGSSLNGSLAWILHQDLSTPDEADVVEVKVGSIGTRIKLEPRHLRPIDLTPRWHYYRNDHDHVDQAPVRQRGSPDPIAAMLSNWADFATLCASCVEVSGVALNANGGMPAEEAPDHGSGAASNILSLTAEFFPSLDTLNVDDNMVVSSSRTRSYTSSHSSQRISAASVSAARSPARPGAAGTPDGDDVGAGDDGAVAFLQHQSPAPETMQLIKNGNTALHWAAWKNHITLLRQLLSNGSSATHPNRAGQTALHWAAKRGSIQASQLLLGSGAIIGARDALGKTATDVAKERGFLELVALLEKAQACADSAAAAAATGGAENSTTEEQKAFDVLLYEETLEGGLGAYDDGSPGTAENGESATELGYPCIRSLTIRRSDGEKLGLRLQSSKEHAGTLACKITGGGAAARAGIIQDGDLILTIQFKSVFELSHKELIAMIGQAGPSLELNVVQPAEDDFKFLALEEASGYELETGFDHDHHSGIAPNPPPSATERTVVVAPPLLRPDVQQIDHNPTSLYRDGIASVSEAMVMVDRFETSSPLHQQQKQPVRSSNCVSATRKLVHLGDPDVETSTTVQYKIPNVSFDDNKSLRITLPSWACTRVLRHVRVRHRKGGDGWKSIVATGDGMLNDNQPTYQSVRAWGFCLSTNGGMQYLVPGATAMLHAFNQAELDGHLVTVLCVLDNGRFDVQVKISGRRLVTTLDHLRGIQGDAQYYEYKSASTDYVEALGVRVPYVDADASVEANFEDWNAGIGVLHAGAIELLTSNGAAVVSCVEIEFFPAHVPAYAGGVPISVDEQIFSAGTQFIPLLSGLPGLLEQPRFPSVENRQALSPPAGTPWCVGSGWISNGSQLVPVQERHEGRWHVNSDGVFKIPLKDGFRVLSIEVAIRDYADAAASDENTPCSSGTVWCKFSRQDGEFVFRRTVGGNNILSGGPQTNDHVAIAGDELLVGSDLAPAWLLGYRITYCESDPAIKDINVLRYNKAREQRDIELMATQLLEARTRKELEVESRTIRAPGREDTLGIGTFGAVLQAKTCLGGKYALKPFKAKDGFVDFSASELFECVAKLANLTNHDNVAPIRGLCAASDYTGDPLETISYVLLELFPLGSLRDTLDNGEPISVKMQLEILCGVSSGMHHLHTHTRLPICHGDLKASNIMLRSDFTPCLSDFGLARFKLSGGLQEPTIGVAAVLPSCVAGSIPWMAPELLAGSSYQPTRATDLYAFAMLMYEIMTRNVPWHDTSNNEVVVEKVMGGFRPAFDPFPDPTDMHIERLMRLRQEDCCCHDKLQRQVSFLGVRTWMHQILRLASQGDSDVTKAGKGAEEEPRSWRWPLAALNGNQWNTHEATGVQFLDAQVRDEKEMHEQVAAICNHVLGFTNCDMHRIIALNDTDAAVFFESLLRGSAEWVNSAEVKDWQSASDFLRCGQNVFSSPNVVTCRTSAWSRLRGPELFPVAASSTFLDAAPVHVVYIAAASIDQAWQHVGSGFKTAERYGPLGFGVYASHDAHAAKNQAKMLQVDGTGALVTIVALMLLVNPYPVASTEMPGKTDHLAGQRVTPGYGAHVAFVKQRTMLMQPTALWEVQTPSTMVMVEKHLLLPFAIIPDADTD